MSAIRGPSPAAARRAVLAVAGVVLCVSLATGAGCAPDEAPEPPAPPHDGPNLLLVTIDTLRLDHTSTYGYAHDTTPQLTRLAEAGVRFDLAYAPTAVTLPTHASLFTGLYPPAHGVVKNGLTLADDHLTLAERLSRRGYQTAAVVSSFVLASRFGAAQGFETYDDAFDPDEATAALDTFEGHAVPGGFDRRADATNRRAMRWLWEERNPERPFFLFVHYFDPHSPYQAPDEFALRFPPPERGPAGRERVPKGYAEAVRNYDGEIAFTDRELGRLLEAVSSLGLDEDTLVLVTADHAEGLLDHGHMGHEVQVYEESVRVPLLLRWIGTLPAGRRIAEPVEFVDLLPTLLALVGLPEPGRLPGRDLSAALRGEAPLDPERPVFLHRRHFDQEFMGSLRVEGEEFAVRQGDWKYIDRPEQRRAELYHLPSDPGERADRSDSEPEHAARLARRLARWRHTLGPGGPVPPVPEDAREALEALGYVE